MLCLEVRAKLLSCHTEASVACSRQVYHVSASDRDFLTKNIDLGFRPSSSLNKDALTEASDTAR